MAVEVERLKVVIEADARAYNSGLAVAAANTQEKLSAIEAKYAGLNAKVGQSMRATAAQVVDATTRMSVGMAAAGRAALDASVANEKIAAGFARMAASSAKVAPATFDIAGGMSKVGKAALENAVFNERFIAGMSKLGGTAQFVAPLTGAINRIPPPLRALNAELKNTVSGMAALRANGGGIGAMFGGIGAALGISAVVEYANSWTRVTRGLEGSEQAFGITLKSASELNKLANDARVDLDAYAKLYTRTSAAIQGYGFAAGTAEKVTSTLSKALKLGGASASEQASVLLQFSQALQKGKLDGDEFRTVMENAGIVQELLAKRLNVTKGAIIKMAADGKLQIKDLVGAMVDGGDQVERIFRQMPQTVDEAFMVLRNNFIEFIGTADKATGATGKISAAIVAVSRNLDIFAVAAGAILSSLTVRMAMFAAASFAAGGPLGLLAAAIGGLAVAYGLFGDKVKLSEDGLVTLKGAVQGFFDVINRTAEVEAYNSQIAYLEIAAKKSASAQRELNDAIKARDELLKNTPQGRADTAVKKAQDDVKALGKFIDDAMKSLSNLFGLQPENNVLEGLANQAERIRNALADAGKAPGFVDQIAERARQLEMQKGIEEKNIGKGLADFYAGKKPDGKKENPTATVEKSKYQSEIDQIKKRTEALKAEIATIGQSTFAQEKAKAVAELRFAAAATAAKEGRKVSAEEVAAIEKLSTAYATVQAQAAFLNKLQADKDGIAEARQELELIGLYGQELDAARNKLELLNAAKKAGVTLDPDRKKEIEETANAKAAFDNYKKAVEDLKATSADALKGFINDMREGKSASEALGNALDRLATKFLDAGIDMAVNSLIGGATKPGTPFASMFGFADGGVFTPGKGPASLPRFAKGGVSKSAAIFGEAGPEAAVPLPDGRRIPVDLRMPEMPKAVAASAAPVVNFAPVFNVQGGEQAAATIKTDVVPQLKKMVQTEIVEMFNRNPRFARSGI